MPSRFSLSAVTFPTPWSLLTGRAETKSSTWSGVMTNSPLGFFQSLAILARNLFGATPADTVMCSWLETRRRMSWAMRVALPPKWALAETSR
ncbi:hypothetical protein D3C76_1152270 [compost metagenome]